MFTNPQDDVHQFHLKFGHPTSPQPDGRLLAQHSTFRKERIREEAEELCEAIDSGDLVQIARECIDLIYVTLGVMVILGMPFFPMWRIVHTANMQKDPHPDGAQGKPIKPEGWESPDKKLAEHVNDLQKQEVTVRRAVTKAQGGEAIRQAGIKPIVPTAKK